MVAHGSAKVTHGDFGSGCAIIALEESGISRGSFSSGVPEGLGPLLRPHLIIHLTIHQTIKWVNPYRLPQRLAQRSGVLGCFCHSLRLFSYGDYGNC